MVADATRSRRAPARQPGLLGVRVALIGPALDARLAAGADPGSSPELALRARRLVDPRRRARFARSLRRAVASAELARGGRPRARGAAVPVSRAAVLKARPTLLALADDLEQLRQPAVRGVALTVRLLREGDGPLYRPWRPDELRAAAAEARRAL